MEMAAAVGAAVAWTATASPRSSTEVTRPPVVGIKAGRRIGKTGEAIAQIAAIPGVEQMNIEIFVPDHRLAEELAERVRAVVASRRQRVRASIHAELRVLVIRGRGALDTDGEPMCQKAELAEEIGRPGSTSSDTLCIGPGRALRICGKMPPFGPISRQKTGNPHHGARGDVRPPQQEAA